MTNKILRNNVCKPPQAGKGRPKGSPNKTTALLKDAILQAATDAGGGDLAAYLRVQAIKNPAAFLSLLSKVLPIQMADNANGQQITIRHIITGVPRPGDEQVVTLIEGKSVQLGNAEIAGRKIN